MSRVRSPHSAQRFESLARLAQAVSGSIELQPVLDTVAAAALEMLPDASAAIWVIEEDRLLLRAEAGSTGPHHPDRVTELRFGEGLNGTVAAAGETLVVRDLRDDPRAASLPRNRQDRLVSFIGVPLRAKDRLVGVLSLATHHRHNFTPHEIKALAAFADQAAIAIDRARVYERLADRVRRLKTLTRLNQLMSSSLDLDLLLGEIARAVAKLTDAPVASFWTADDRARTLKLVAASDPALGDFPVTEMAYGQGALGWIATHREPLDVPDVFADSRFVADWWRAHELTSFFGLPVILDGALLAVLAVNRRRPFRIDADDHDLLESFAAQAAVALRNAQLFEASEERRRTAEGLAEVGRNLAESLDREEVAQRVVQSVSALVGARAARLYDLEKGTGDLVLLASTGSPRAWNERLAKGTGAIGLALREHRIVWSPDAVTDARIDFQPEARARLEESPDRSVLAVPLVANGKPLGALAVVDRTGRHFGEREIRLAQVFADQAALALDHAELHLVSERRRREAEVFAELARTVNASLELESVLQQVGEWARELCRSDSATIALREPNSETMVHRYFFGSTGTPPAVRIEPGKGSGGHVLATGRPFRTADYGADPVITKDYLGSTQANGTVAQLVVPIRSGSRIEGLIYVANRSSRAFTEHDEAILLRLADHAAIALHNAQMYAREQAARTEAEALGERYRNVVESSIQGVFVDDGELIKFANPAFARIFGYGDPRTLIGLSKWHLIAPSEVARLRGYEQDRRRGKPVPQRYEYQGVRQDGHLVWVETLATTTSWDSAPAYLSTCLDITERKRAEERLLESQRFLQSTLDALSAHIAVLDEHGTIVAVNAAWQRFAEANALAGTSAGVGVNYLAACEAAADGQQGSRALARAIRDVLAGRRDELTLEYESPGPQEERWLLVRVTRFSGDGPTRVVVARESITEQKRAEEALRRNEEHVRQMQKMEAVGRLAGGVAHDFNNLLTVITGRSQLLLRRLREADPVRRDLALIQKTAERATALTRQLLAFSRKQVLQPRVVSVEAVVSGLAPMLQRLLGEDIELDIAAPAAASPVKVDPGQLEQVIVNLAVNARDAMPRGGRLAIEIAAVELDERRATHLGGLEAGPHVMLVVSDSGIGIGPETLPRIFEPFFTTKGPGQGTGLGLATVYGIVQQHQGAIAVESVREQGTTFRVYLPMTSEPLEPADERTAGLPGGAETILLVEDEHEVRTLARDILEQAGYTVLEAGNGQEALEISRRYTESIQLLLTDVIMPSMSGRELAERIDHVRPGLKVLYMSGYTDDALGPRALLAGERVVLQKPFTPEALAKTIRTALDG